MILFAAHAVGFIIYWAMTNQMAEVLALTYQLILFYYIKCQLLDIVFNKEKGGL